MYDVPMIKYLGVEMLSKTIRSTVILLVVQLMFGCSVLNQSNAANDFPSSLLLIPQDLPRGWSREIVYSEEVPNAESITVVYVGSKNPQESHIVVSHQLSYYSTSSDAKDAYTLWESEWFTTAKLMPPNDWSFQPQDINDQFRFGCVNQTVNEKPFLVCTYLQHHDRVISLVLANLDGETMNLEQFANALTLLDIRMNQPE